MKILHFITRLILGGAQENTLLSCRGQVEDGHEVMLVHGPIYGPEGSLDEMAQQSGASIKVLDAMQREVRPITDIRCYKQCLQLIQQVKPDVVHTHSSKAGIIARMAAWKANVPAVIHTIHGLAFHPYQSSLKNKMYITAERMAAKRCHRIVSVADAMTEQALAAGIGSRSQYCTVYSGMETQTFTQASGQRQQTRNGLGFTDNDLVIGTVARLAELKGHDDLLDALPELMKNHTNVKLLWVGDGWWRERLEKRIADMGLAKRVILTGLVTPAKIPTLMASMDMLVHPSYREGLPRTLPQALLCGMPVISYDCDGAGEVCMDGQTGKLVPTGDINGLAQAITWMVEHESQRKDMAKTGRQLCAKRFDWRIMVKQLNEVYQTVLNENQIS